ncbi:MAG TPA: S49 family peptidase [Gemmataceae bacterium]|nr:S49 family peptidase [Gemmataceae bacterium]
MRRLIPFLAVVLASAGCFHPFKAVTWDHVTVDRPINGHVLTEIPPVSPGGPLHEVPVGGPRCCKGPKVAIIDVDGLILNTDMTGQYSLGENPVALFQEKLEAAAADPSVCAVVLRVNSPGGGVAATETMWQELQAFRARTGRPVVASLLDVGAGGAYYLATASDAIFAQPSTVTGGVGVIINLYNLIDTMGYFNVRYQPIKAGPNIDMGTTAHPLTPEARKQLQAMADEYHARFQQAVRQARPRVELREGTTFDGRVFTGREALERGLVDRLGSLPEAIAAACELAGQPNATVVLFRRCNDPAHSIYAVTPNVPLQSSIFPASVPGLDRSRLPSFLYMWQPDQTLEKLSGK